MDASYFVLYHEKLTLKEVEKNNSNQNYVVVVKVKEKQSNWSHAPHTHLQQPNDTQLIMLS